MAYNKQSRNNFRDSRSELEETVIQVKRVSKKTKGGNQIGFSVLTVVGDKKGSVGVGLGKGPDVASSIRKGFSIAKSNMFKIHMVSGTIPHQVVSKYGASRIMIKPAPEGTGVIAGGAVRAIAEAAGVENIVAKILGTNNKTTNVYNMVKALKSLKSPEEKAKRFANK